MTGVSIVSTADADAQTEIQLAGIPTQGSAKWSSEQQPAARLTT